MGTRARPRAWGDAGEVPGSRATARGVAGGRFARTLPPIVSRLLAAPEACARTARKMKKGGRETSVRMRNGGGGGEGSSERRETRALGSGHATGSALGRRPDSSARGVFQTRPPGRISRGFFLDDARKPKRTSRSFQRRRRSAFRPERAAAARRNARASAGETLRGVTEGMLTSGDTSACRRREEWASGRASPTRFGNAFKRRGACSNGIENHETLN